MEIKATLKIQLLANDVIVAESDDPVLWNRVLQTAQKAAQTPKMLGFDGTPQASAEAAFDEGHKTVVEIHPPAMGNAKTPLQRMAQTIGASAEEIEGAINPTDNEPYIRLEDHVFAVFKKNTPSSGKGAVGVGVLAATLLTQWAKYSAIGDVTTDMIQKVISNLGLSDSNLPRNLKRCAWLSIHDSVVKLNPSTILDADNLTKAFCKKIKLSEAGGNG